MTKTTADKDRIASVYLFSGEVDSRRDAEVERLISSMVDPGSEIFDLSKFEGDDATADGILGAAMTLPLASQRKVVIVNRVERLAAEDQVRIAAFLPKLGPSSCLILLIGDEDRAARKSKQSSKKDEDEDENEDEDNLVEGTEKKKKKRKPGLQPEITKAVKAHGHVVEFAKMRADTVAGLVSQGLKVLGKKAEPSALQSLARSIAANPSSLDRELEKLATYIGERETITFDDVDAVVTKSPEEQAFPLIDAIAGKMPGRAVQLLNETMAWSTKLDSEVLKLISMMAGHFRLLYQVKFLKTQGVRSLANVPDELRELLADGKHNPLSRGDWQLNKLVEQSKAFTLPELQECMKEILACELAVKGIGKREGSPRLNLEMLVFKLSRRGG